MAFDLGTIWAEIGLNTKKLDDGLMKAQVKLANADKTINTFGQKLTLASTKLITAGGIMAGSVAAVGVAAVKMASEFETSMRNVNSISKLSEDQFKAQSKEVVELSKKLPQSAKVLADGLYDISSSGFAGADGMKVLTAAAEAASAGLTDTATSAKGITAVLNAYSFEADQADRVADTMFKTVDKGVISFEELSGQIGEVVGTANIANVGFEELSGMIAYMTTKGISGAETMTALNKMMLAVITPTEEMAVVLKNAGFESGQMAIEQIGLAGVMDLVAKAANGDVAAIQAISGDMRAFKAVASLTGSGVEELNKFMEGFSSVAATAGAKATALAEQSKSLSFQLEILKNNGKALGIELGTKLIPPITNLVKSLNDLTPAQKDAIYNTAELTLKFIAAGGGVLLLAGGFGKLRAAMLANPIGAVIAGFVALNGAIDTGANKLEELDNVWATIGATLLRTVAPLTAVKNGLSDNITVAKALADGTISLSDTKNLNVFTMGREIEKIKELRAEKEKEVNETVHLANSTQNYTDFLSQSTPQVDKYKVAINETAAATDKATKSTDELIASINNLFNLNQSTTEATWDFEDALKNYNDTLKDNSATERDRQEALFGVQDALEYLQIAMLKEYEDTATSIEQKEKLRNKYIEIGLEAVSTGAMSETAFIEMANSFGLSVADIIKFAKEMGIVLDEETMPRTIDIKVNLEDREFYTKFNAVKRTINESGIGIGASLGIFANGGIVGMPHIPQASMGMVVPQTGRAVPIIAHEGEMILNTSQQNNLIEALWGVANGKSAGSQVVNNYYIEATIREEADIDKFAEKLYKMQKTSLVGGGMRGIL